MGAGQHRNPIKINWIVTVTITVTMIITAAISYKILAVGKSNEVNSPIARLFDSGKAGCRPVK